jgi:hypothetical protein
MILSRPPFGCRQQGDNVTECELVNVELWLLVCEWRHIWLQGVDAVKLALSKVDIDSSNRKIRAFVQLPSGQVRQSALAVCQPHQETPRAAVSVWKSPRSSADVSPSDLPDRTAGTHRDGLLLSALSPAAHLPGKGANTIVRQRFLHDGLMHKSRQSVAARILARPGLALEILPSSLLMVLCESQNGHIMRIHQVFAWLVAGIDTCD